MKPYYSEKGITIYHGECLTEMAKLPDASVDMVLCDLPYGTTACSWDSVIPFPALWHQYERIIKTFGAIVLTASQPFSSALVTSNIDLFKYEWIWLKNRATGHVHAKNKPMKRQESVLVFSKGVTVHTSQTNKRMPYNPQGLVPVFDRVRRRNDAGDDAVMSSRRSHRETVVEFENYPDDILPYPIEMGKKRFHPAQKPVALMEYLIKTYTHEGMTVLDNCMGSGTTGIACMKTARKFIGIEREEKYCEIAAKRLSQEVLSFTAA